MKNSEDYGKSDFMNRENKDLEKPQNSLKTNANNPTSESKICLFFSRYKYCKYRNNCKFLHCNQSSESSLEKDKNVTQNYELLNKNEIRNLMNPNVHNTIKYPKHSNRHISTQVFLSKKRECRYFKAGNCDRGNNCPYQHTFQNPMLRNFDERNKHIKKKRVPICHYFKKGNCQRGITCKFFHQNEQQLDSKILLNELENDSYKPLDTKYTADKAINRINSTIDKSDISNVEKDQNISECDNHSSFEEIKENIICGKTDQSSPDINEDAPNASDQINLEICEKRLSNITLNENTPSITSMTKSSLLFKPINLGKKLYDLSSISAEEITNLRNIELEQLRKRYPKCILSKENQVISFVFEPSDPDWPFDLKSLDLEVSFPDNYPVEACKICVLPANNIPEMLLRYLNKSIKEWIEERYEYFRASKQIELMFRPFLKWLDKNLEELFIIGLRRVKQDIDARNHGIEFVPVEKLFPKNNTSICLENDASELQKTCTNEMLTVENTTSIQENSLLATSKNMLENPVSKSTSLDNSALKYGIKILFNGLELVEGVATLTCTKIALTVHCIRCKTSGDLKCSSGKNNTVRCSKCSKLMECTFNSSILHQFSNVAGNLNALECQIVDINLVESYFLIDCLNCSKQIQLNGLHYGQKQKRWCNSCNEKLIFSIESTKFQTINSAFVARKNAPVKKTEKRKDPMIKEGQPLPDFGACKHYKKSYRWLRFPCCGKLYPCDICHDEKESDHEMKFASRMICGYCSKEQPYSKDKPCISCSGGLIAKSGTHWEGGKGCRNKIKMARDDKHKYVGTSKTTSKKAQAIGKKK